MSFGQGTGCMIAAKKTIAVTYVVLNVCFTGLQTEKLQALKLWVQREILWVNAILVGKFYSFVNNVCCHTGQNSYLVSCYNAVAAMNQNSLKSSSVNSPGWEKMTPLNVWEYLFGELPSYWSISMSSPYPQTNSYFNHTHITLGRPVLKLDRETENVPFLLNLSKEICTPPLL